MMPVATNPAEKQRERVERGEDIDERDDVQFDVWSDRWRLIPLRLRDAWPFCVANGQVQSALTVDMSCPLRIFILRV
jgi:hypothetical protein